MNKPKLIIFLVMDTARYKSFDFDSEKINPNLNKAVSSHDFINFKKAISPAPWTIPSHMSMFTGLLPSIHKCKDYGFKVRTSIKYLPKIMKDKNYKTVGVTSNGLLNRGSNFNHGFDEYICTWNLYQNLDEHYRIKKTIKNHGFLGFTGVIKSLYSNGFSKSLANIIYRTSFPVKKDSTVSTRRTTKLAIDKIEESVQKSEPMFLFLNYMQPHMDYNPPEPFKSKFQTKGLDSFSQSPIKFYSGQMSNEEIVHLRELYQAELSYLDYEIGLIINKVSNLGIMDDAAIVILSDHGEHIGEHNHISHYFSLYNETLHVPLLLKLPNNSGNLSLDNSKDFVSTADIFPTLCNLVGFGDYDDNKYAFQFNKREEIISELFMPSDYGYFLQSCKNMNPSFSKSKFVSKGMHNQKALYSNEYKIILREKAQNEVYNFDTDYDESNNIINSLESGGIMKILDTHGKSLETSNVSKSDSEKLKNRLRNLGYY